MVKTIQLTRINEMLDENRDLIQQLKSSHEDYEHKHTNIKKKVKGKNLDNLDLDTNLDNIKPMANNRLNTPNM